MNKLKDLKIGEVARIIGYESGSKSYRQRLLAMGLTPGTAFHITRVAPLGDPLQLQVRGFALLLRKHEAQILCIERLNT